MGDNENPLKESSVADKGEEIEDKSVTEKNIKKKVIGKVVVECSTENKNVIKDSHSSLISKGTSTNEGNKDNSKDLGLDDVYVIMDDIFVDKSSDVNMNDVLEKLDFDIYVVPEKSMV